MSEQIDQAPLPRHWKIRGLGVTGRLASGAAIVSLSVGREMIADNKKESREYLPNILLSVSMRSL